MHVLNGFMHQHTEYHGTGSDRHEFQFFVELVLKSTGLIYCDVRSEGVGILEVNGLHVLKIEISNIEFW